MDEIELDEPAPRNLIRATAAPMRSWTMSLRSFLSTWKGVDPWTAASAFASALRSACSASQSHSSGGWWSASGAMVSGARWWGRVEVEGADGVEEWARGAEEGRGS